MKMREKPTTETYTATLTLHKPDYVADYLATLNRMLDLQEKAQWECADEEEKKP